MGAVEQEEGLHGQTLALQLGAHLERHAGAERVAGDAVRSGRLQPTDAVHVEGGQSLDAAQRGGWGGDGLKPGLYS